MAAVNTASGLDLLRTSVITEPAIIGASVLDDITQVRIAGNAMLVRKKVLLLAEEVPPNHVRVKWASGFASEWLERNGIKLVRVKDELYAPTHRAEAIDRISRVIRIAHARMCVSMLAGQMGWAPSARAMPSLKRKSESPPEGQPAAKRGPGVASDGDDNLVHISFTSPAILGITRRVTVEIDAENQGVYIHKHFFHEVLRFSQLQSAAIVEYLHKRYVEHIPEAQLDVTANVFLNTIRSSPKPMLHRNFSPSLIDERYRLAMQADAQAVLARVSPLPETPLPAPALVVAATRSDSDSDSESSSDDSDDEEAPPAPPTPVAQESGIQTAMFMYDYIDSTIARPETMGRVTQWDLNPSGSIKYMGALNMLVGGSVGSMLHISPGPSHAEHLNLALSLYQNTVVVMADLGRSTASSGQGLHAFIKQLNVDVVFFMLCELILAQVRNESPGRLEIGMNRSLMTGPEIAAKIFAIDPVTVREAVEQLVRELFQHQTRLIPDVEQEPSKPAEDKYMSIKDFLGALTGKNPHEIGTPLNMTLDELGFNMLMTLFMFNRGEMRSFGGHLYVPRMTMSLALERVYDSQHGLRCRSFVTLKSLWYMLVFHIVAIHCHVTSKEDVTYVLATVSGSASSTPYSWKTWIVINDAKKMMHDEVFQSLVRMVMAYDATVRALRASPSLALPASDKHTILESELVTVNTSSTAKKQNLFGIKRQRIQDVVNSLLVAGDAVVRGSDVLIDPVALTSIMETMKVGLSSRVKANMSIKLSSPRKSGKTSAIHSLLNKR